jgi:hypothetical protein
VASKVAALAAATVFLYVGASVNYGLVEYQMVFWRYT